MLYFFTQFAQKVQCLLLFKFWVLDLVIMADFSFASVTTALLTNLVCTILCFSVTNDLFFDLVMIMDLSSMTTGSFLHFLTNVDFLTLACLAIFPFSL